MVGCKRMVFISTQGQSGKFEKCQGWSCGGRMSGGEGVGALGTSAGGGGGRIPRAGIGGRVHTVRGPRDPAYVDRLGAFI